MGWESLLITYSDNTVDEYDLQNLASHTINVPISTYHTYGRYNFINPTTASISTNGILYILANDTTLNGGKGGIVVLAYRTYEPMIRTFYTSMDLDEPTITSPG